MMNPNIAFDCIKFVRIKKTVTYWQKEQEKFAQASVFH